MILYLTVSSAEPAYKAPCSWPLQAPKQATVQALAHTILLAHHFFFGLVDWAGLCGAGPPSSIFFHGFHLLQSSHPLLSGLYSNDNLRLPSSSFPSSRICSNFERKLDCFLAFPHESNFAQFHKMAETAATAAPAAQTARPTRPDEAIFKQELIKAEQAHKESMDKLVS